MLSFSLESLGCKVNNFEANASADLLIEAGYKLVDSKDNPDFILIYTCAVTNVAESKTRKLIRSLHRNHPNSKLIAVGCFVQVSTNQLLNELPLDLCIGSNHKKDIVSLVHQLFASDDSFLCAKDNFTQAPFQNLGAGTSQTHTRANLKIQDGCNQFCSYCIIPYARGRETCLSFEEIKKQAKLLAKNHQEIILTGIHTGRYHDGNVTLADVLDYLAKTYPTVRFRISSIESSEISQQLLDVMKKYPNIAHHLHIPLQAGCDSQLKLMNRPYTTGQYLDMLTNIRQQINDIAISCDYIVGIVNESEQDFNDAKAFIQQCHFAFMHVFPYSRKKGTKADSMKGHLNEVVKKQRTQEILALAESLKCDYLNQSVNTKKNVLIESVKNGCSYGYSDDYCYVKVNSKLTIGSFYEVIIEKVNDDELEGKVQCY